MSFVGREYNRKCQKYGTRQEETKINRNLQAERIVFKGSQSIRERKIFNV